MANNIKNEKRRKKDKLKYVVIYFNVYVKMHVICISLMVKFCQFYLCVVIDFARIITEVIDE